MRYVSTTETNKLIRQALKEAFPRTKFSVRADGNATTVRWADGPTERQVAEVVDRFKGGGFDSMQDLEYDVPAALDGQKVRFMVRYIFCERSFSRGALEAAYQEAAKRFRTPVPPFESVVRGSGDDCYLDESCWHFHEGFPGRNLGFCTLDIARKTSYEATCPSPTAERVAPWEGVAA